VATWARPTGGGTMDRQAVQTNAEAAPSSSSEGMNCAGVAGYLFIATCDEGQTFNDAAATFAAWVWDETVSLWSRCPDADVTVGANGVAKRSIATAFTVARPSGRRIHVWDGTGVTSGSVTTTYATSLLTGERSV
jgi:hypothetical protein